MPGTSRSPAGRRGADPHPPASQPAQLVDLGHGAVELGQHVAGPPGDHGTSLRRPHVSAGALEQRAASSSLIWWDSADWATVQLLGGAREVAQPGDGLDRAQLSQLNRD
jgi:hypothetical protein